MPCLWSGFLPLRHVWETSKTLRPTSLADKSHDKRDARFLGGKDWAEPGPPELTQSGRWLVDPSGTAQRIGRHLYQAVCCTVASPVDRFTLPASGLISGLFEIVKSLLCTIHVFSIAET